MTPKSILAISAAIAVTSTLLSAQQPSRPLSPDGIASVQVLGTWTSSTRQTYTMGGARYEGGKWIDILYGRPLLRGREAFSGSGAEYGKATYGPDATVWRAGANFTTRLRSEVPLVIGGTTVPAGEHTLFIELKSPTEWTFIVSNWPAQTKYDPSNKTEIYGAFNYTSDKDVLRTSMKVETLPIKIEQLTWQFLDMTADGGRMSIMWGTTMGSVPFKVSR
jgi:hypothetical protein